MLEKQLNYKNSTINYYEFGHGPRVIVCFHGYAENGKSYSFLEKYLKETHTLFAIDLPFHGSTGWNEGLNFSVNDLLEIVRKIIGTSTKSYSLVGFSLGGRVALSLYEQNPAEVDRLILIAPDGLKVNFWYWLSTQTFLGNKLFLLTMKKPQWFFGFLKILNSLRLVNSSIFKFVNFYIGDPEVRQLLYKRWTTLRNLKPNIRNIKNRINEHQTPVRLLYGKHDRIILSSVGERFSKRIENNCRITIISSGHQVLHEKHISELLPVLSP